MRELHGGQATAFLLAACLGLAIVGYAKYARGHEPYTQWQRPDTGGSCCNNQDCRQASARFNGQLWEVLLDGEWVEVPPGRVLDPSKEPNPDGMHHVCAGPARYIYCFMPGETKF
jgi:hypothetical protein